MKFILFNLFLAVVCVYSLEDSDLGIKPKRGLGYSLGYSHAAPLLSHSYVAPAPAIVHHAAPVLSAPAVVHAPIARYHAPLLAHAPISYGHAPLAAPIAYGHSSLAAPLAYGHSSLAAPLAYGHSSLAAPLAYGHSSLTLGHSPLISSLHHYKK